MKKLSDDLKKSIARISCYRFSERVVTFFVLIALINCSGDVRDESASHKSSGRPNIIILYADDLGYGDVGVYNPYSKIPTPNIDALAENGIRFTDAHSSSGICSPSRYALLTGQYHWRKFHSIVSSFESSVFEPDEFTIAKMLQENGYKTAAIGKWHLGWDWEAIKVEGNNSSETTLPWGAPYTLYQPEAFDWSQSIPGGPVDQGFDYYFGDGTINFPPYTYIENDRVVEVPSTMMDETKFSERLEGDWYYRPGPMAESWNPNEVLPTITAKAEDWISQQDNKTPFFLYFAFPSPHAPIVPNQEFIGSSDAGPYGDFVFETDAMVGRLLDALGAAGLAENTLIIFSSDNGAEKFAYERYRQYSHWSSGDYRGLKRDLFEGGHRVPFIVRWPEVIKQATVSSQTINQVDIVSTIASIIGTRLTSSEAIDSHDYAQVLNQQQPLDRVVRQSSVHNTFEGAYALRQGDWLYINTPDAAHTEVPQWYSEDMQYEVDATEGLLYNLAEDPSQNNSLYLDYPEKVAQMEALLSEYVSGKPSAPHSISMEGAE